MRQNERSSGSSVESSGMYPIEVILKVKGAHNKGWYKSFSTFCCARKRGNRFLLCGWRNTGTGSPESGVDASYLQPVKVMLDRALRKLI